jgi:integrase/recombinase XerD
MKDKANYLSDEQIDRMINLAPTENVKLLIYLLYTTGRRVSELLQLKPEHIDFDAGLIRWNILKKRKPKQNWIAAADSTLETLEMHIRYYNISPDQYIFGSTKPDKQGNRGHYTRKWAFSHVRGLAQKAGIVYKEGKIIRQFTKKDGSIIISKPGWHPHHLRHSHSINFLKRANSPHAIRVLQQQLGHSNINTTSTYLEYSQDDRRELLNKVFNKKKVI